MAVIVMITKTVTIAETSEFSLLFLLGCLLMLAICLTIINGMTEIFRAKRISESNEEKYANEGFMRARNRIEKLENVQVWIAPFEKSHRFGL